MEILVNGGAIILRTGTCNHLMQRTKVDLKGFVGSIARVKLVDESTGNWGHITFDDLRYETTCDGTLKIFKHYVSNNARYLRLFRMTLSEESVFVLAIFLIQPGSSDPGLRSGRGHWVLLLEKILYSHCASLYPAV